MILRENELREIVENVWTCTTGGAVEWSEPSAALDAGRPQVTGCVRLRGGWNGAVTIRCSPRLAGRTACVMDGGTPEAEASDAEGSDAMFDALGEALHMIAGNVKALLPGPTSLGQPVVTQGEAALAGLSGAKTACSVRFTFEGEPCVVTVFAG